VQALRTGPHGSVTHPVMAPLIRLIPLLLLLACARRPPAAMPDPERPRAYKVGVVTANGDAFATSITTLRVVPRGDQVYAFTTEHTEGSWEEGAAAMTFDSATPRPSDPWPVTLQHAVATVPAPIRVDDRGRLVDFEQQEAWKRAARAAIDAAELPPQAQVAAESLIDPQGVLRDLRRNFPGLPEIEGTWEREETIAGVPARRVETCEQQEQPKSIVYTCTGTIQGPQEGTARLVDGTSRTVLTIDRSGLVDLDLTYEGTLVLLAPDGKQVLDRAVAGRRKVVRQ